MAPKKMKKNEVRRARLSANMAKFQTTSKKRKKAEDGLYVDSQTKAKLLKKNILKKKSEDNKT